MAESIQFLSDWWRWWSNPLVNMHTTKVELLPYTKAQLASPDFLLFLELRSILRLSDRPDRDLDEHMELRSLALATAEEKANLNLKSAVLGMDAGILQANAHQWEKQFGIKSPDEVRNIIQLWNQIPYKLKPWQESMLLNINSTDSTRLDLHDRAHLVLGAYLMSFYPEYFTRWSLTLPHALSLKLDTVDLLPEDCKSTIDEWLRPAVKKVHQQVLERYPDGQAQLPHDRDPDEQEALSKLEVLEDFEDA